MIFLLSLTPETFEIQEEEPWLNLKAVLLNINPGYNNDIVNACKTLSDYVIYTSRVRAYAEQMKIEDAVEKAITECIAEGILAELGIQVKKTVVKWMIHLLSNSLFLPENLLIKISQ